MVKLCCVKDDYGINQEYYLDGKTQKVYIACMTEYYEGSRFKLTPGLIFMIGPCVTITGILFDDQRANFTAISRFLGFIFLIIGIVATNRAYNSSEEKKAVYIRKKAEGELLSREQVRELNRKGRTERVKQIILLVLCLIAMFFAMVMYHSERNISGVIILYAGIFGIEILIKMLAPLKRHKEWKQLL